MTLNEPFLGTSIIPVLTDTGAVATAIDNSAPAKPLLALTAASVTTANTDTLASGAMLYLDGQPVTSNEVVAPAAPDLEILAPDGGIHLQVASLESKIYRRTENPENQNFYITEGDTGVNAEKSYCSTRGSSNI